MRRTLVCLLVGIGPLYFGVAGEALGASPKTTPRPAHASPPDAKKADGPVFVLMGTTTGDILLELDAAKAPLTVANFLTYVDEGFYEGTVFHRVFQSYVVQAGGYETASLHRKTKGLHAPVKAEWPNGLENKRWSVGAARVPGKPNSATSQFYINVVDNPRLDEAQADGVGWVVFGRVIRGKSVVDKIRSADCRVHMVYREPSGTPVTPKNAITIRSMCRADANGKPLVEAVEFPPTSEPGQTVKPQDAPPAPDGADAEPVEEAVEQPEEVADMPEEADEQPDDVANEPEEVDEQPEDTVNEPEEVDDQPADADEQPDAVNPEDAGADPDEPPAEEVDEPEAEDEQPADDVEPSEDDVPTEEPADNPDAEEDDADEPAPEDTDTNGDSDAPEED